ncbi:MAG: sigma-70 family RNA polymerase sigma factor [Saprospiraceae bacterium]|nr:sigma-70 family RNA polymerase sigma factor [Saprospiraceae bacterium]
MFFNKKNSFDPNDINSIISSCLKNERQGQQALVVQYLSYSKSICLLYSQNTMDVEEMVNDGFIRVFSNLSKYDSSRSFKSWLRAIFINSCIDHYRKNKSFAMTSSLDDAMEYELEYQTTVIDDMAAEDLLALIQDLTPVYRMVFTLYVVEGYNHREIADMLGIQEGTSKSNLRDARKKLQQMVYERYGQYNHTLKILRS